jgi:hypothetical protein
MENTYSVNTQDWLAATKDMNVSTFIYAAVPVSQANSAFTKEDFDKARQKQAEKSVA